MRRASFIALSLLFVASGAHAVTGTCDAVPLGAVEVQSSAGSAAGVPKSYGNLGAAFAAINAGVLHQGVIFIDVCTNVSEGVTPATLHSSGAGPASYASVTIRPVTSGLTISGGVEAGVGVIQLNGADNVTIDGDDPNTAGTHRDMTIANTANTVVVATSVIRIATSAAVTSADNITIKNLVLNGNVTSGNASGITSTDSSSAVSFGIYVGGNGGETATSAPTAITSTPAKAPSGTTVNSLAVDNNAINRCATGVQFNGAATTVSNGVTITNNTIGASGTPAPAIPPYTSPTTTVYGSGVTISGTNAVTITGNTVQNVISYVRDFHVGIGLSTPIGSGTVSVGNNTINVVESSQDHGAAGIAVGSAAGAYTVGGNTVRDVQSFGQSTGDRNMGINVSTAAPLGVIERNIVNKIYLRSNSNNDVCGVCLYGGNNVTVRNNFISDVNKNVLTNAVFARSTVGLMVGSGTGHKIHHNSVSMFGSLLGTPGSNQLTAAFAIADTGRTGIDVRNNIFANTMTGGTTSSAHVAVFLPASGTAAMNLTWDNNAYFTGSTVGAHGVAQVGSAYTAVPAGSPTFVGLYTAADFNSTSTSPAINVRRYTSSLGSASNDGASFATTTAPPFTSSTDLHIAPGTLTQLESFGAAVGVTNDLDGDPRNAFTPDIGADEFDGVFGDLTQPNIQYTPLGSTTSVANRVLTTTIADALSGVPTAGIGLPAIYFRKGVSGPYSSKQCLHGGGSTYNCEIDYMLVTGGSVATGNSIQYYVAAQDAASTPNIAVNPETGSAGLAPDPPAAGTPPTAPNSYLISAGISGTYFVGTGETVTSLTNPGGIFEFINSDVLTGDTTIEITSDLTAETGMRALNQWIEEGVGGYRLTIKPVGGARVVSGTSAGSAALIKLNGADRVTIDGSLTALAGTDRSLTIRNDNTSGVVISIASAGETDGAADNIVKNCNISGASDDFVITNVGILGSATYAANSNNQIRNNAISRVLVAVSIGGFAATRDQNWLVTENTIGSTVPAEKVRAVGIYIANAQHFEISRNLISGINVGAQTAYQAHGIGVSSGASDGMIESNTIVGVGGNGNPNLQAPAHGISVSTGIATSALMIRNNSVSAIGAYGPTYGIAIFGATGGVSIYHNSVNLNGTLGSRQYSLYVESTATALDVRDNIFRNAFFTSSIPVAKGYAVFSAAPASAFTAINANSYFATGPKAVLGYLGGECTTMTAWKAATGQDADSLDPAVEPNFVSDFNLRPNIGAPVINAGKPVGVLTDIAGSPRSVTAPSMGAYEQPNAVDMSVTVSDNPDPVATQDTITYTITVTNNGPLVATSPAVSDSTPDGTTFVSVSAPAGWNCTSPPVGGIGTVSCSGTTMASGASVVVTLVVKVDLCTSNTTTTNTATVWNGFLDPYLANNTAAATTAITDGGCSDGNPCTADVCVLTPVSHCESAPIACNAPPDDCHVSPGTCTFPGPGICEYATAPNGNPCGDPDATACNAADTCNAAGTCIDRKKPANAVCLPASGDCDLDDVCNGLNDTCAPRYEPSTIECRASTDTCDPAELCTGSSATCPADTTDSSAPVGNSLRASHDRATAISTISWTEAAPGPFNVYRGSLQDGMPWVYNHGCYANGLGTQAITDAVTPAPGELFYFLVSRDGPDCPESSLGPDSLGSERPNTDACPNR